MSWGTSVPEHAIGMHAMFAILHSSFRVSGGENISHCQEELLLAQGRPCAGQRIATDMEDLLRLLEPESPQAPGRLPGKRQHCKTPGVFDCSLLTMYVYSLLYQCQAHVFFWGTRARAVGQCHGIAALCVAQVPTASFDDIGSYYFDVHGP